MDTASKQLVVGRVPSSPYYAVLAKQPVMMTNAKMHKAFPWHNWQINQLIGHSNHLGNYLLKIHRTGNQTRLYKG